MAHGIAVSTPSHSLTDHPWSSSREEVANAYQTDLVAGLTTEKADRNLERFGLNQLETSQQVTWTRMLFAQFANTMVALLLAAAVISGVIGEWTDAVLIGLIVIANAVLGFTQEWTAARAIESLQRMSEPNARVCRNGVWKRIPVAHVTQGDLIEIIAGEIIPADARLIEVTQLEVSEAPLTGESNPIEKSLDAVSDPAPVPDRTCMVYAGTSVVAGRGRAVVTAIGMKTEIGHIAELLAETTHAATPLQQRLDRLTRHLTIAIVAAAVVVFALGFRRHGVAQMLLTSVGLAVAALPEGLPAVITISLAIGAKRMAARKAIIRRLTSVETLGSVKVVCTDKTGTLTQNLMTVTQIVPSHDGVNSSQDLLQAAVLCNDAGSDSDGNLKGSPTEKAFLLIAQDHKIDVGEIRQRFERVAEVPFSSTRKRMITVHRTEQGGHVVFVKGAIEVVLPLCARVAGQEGPVPIDEIHAAATRFAKRGHRVLVFARRYWDANQSRPDEDDWGAGRVRVA